LFTERDNESAPRVAIVNEAFVQRSLGKEEPLGQRLLLEERWISGRQKPGQALPFEIVGVIANVKVWGLERAGNPLIYAPLMQCPRPGGVLTVRTQAEPAGMVRAVRAVVASVDKEVPVTDIRTIEQIAAASVAQPRSQAWIISSFAVVALILAALGIYGVMSYAVAQRTREMGIRMALGARPSDLLRMALGQGMLLAGIGLGLGLAGSLALTRVVESLLYKVKPTDPPTYVAVSALLLTVALLATYIPARRAARVDPLVALRWE
jgi:putative ABC transport system permease protein